MSDDAGPEPSFFLARHENAHREHVRSHLGHSHNHAHNAPKRQDAQATTTTEQALAETTVIATISYVQQIDVDSSGSTFSLETVLENSTADASSAPITSAASPASATVSKVTATGASSSPSTSPSQSLLSSPSISSSSTPTLSIPTSFPSFTANSNSTSSQLISATSGFSTTFSNSTTISSSSSISSSSFTFVPLTSSGFYSSASSVPSSTSSASSSSSSSSSTFSSTSYTSSELATSTAVGGYIGGLGTGSASGATPSSTDSGTNSTSNPSSTPPTSTVVGSVVGSVAGLALIVFFLLFLAKWKKRRNMLSLSGGNEGAEGTGAAATRGLPPTPTGGMAERRSLAFGVPAALANLTGYKNRASQNTDRSLSTNEGGSERGFYRVSGRKLPSVLQTGGDGYGGGIPAENNTLSGSSFYRDSQGFYGGPGPGSPLTMSPIGPPPERDSGIPVMRPSPARTPVTEYGPFGVPPSSPPLQVPRRPGEAPDGLGRSHPSQDGSHASRFTEEV